MYTCILNIREKKGQFFFRGIHSDRCFFTSSPVRWVFSYTLLLIDRKNRWKKPKNFLIRNDCPFFLVRQSSQIAKVVVKDTEYRSPGGMVSLWWKEGNHGKVSGSLSGNKRTQPSPRMRTWLDDTGSLPIPVTRSKTGKHERLWILHTSLLRILTIWSVLPYIAT